MNSLTLYQRWLMLGTAVLAAACGTSRSTGNSACSTVKAIADQSLYAGSNLEKYDPSAVLLLFRASSDRMTIESRCNARLVNKISARHKNSDGTFQDIGDDAIDFSKLHVHLESGESNLELHTSAHCFFRIWDPRVDHQVKNNPAIAAEPLRTLLRDMKTRYQLYRSTLTSPQTIVAFLPDRTPVTFKYKLPVTHLFEKFFAEIDKDGSDLLLRTVGRELSKTSIIVDEVIRRECNVAELAMQKFDSMSAGVAGIKPRKDITDVTDLGQFLSGSAGGPLILDYMGSQLISAGRRRLCFSQSDMMITPITLTESASDVQKTVLAGIESELQKKLTTYLAHINGTPSAQEKFIAEVHDSSTPMPMPADLAACPYTAAYPGLAVTDIFSKRFEKTYIESWGLNPDSSRLYLNAFQKIFPNLKRQETGVGPIQAILSQVVWKSACGVAGLQLNNSGGGCSTARLASGGRCPAVSETGLMTAEGNVLASEIHDRVKRSMRLSSTAMIHQLRRQREGGALALTMPFAELRDYIEFACSAADSPDCVLAGKVKVILDNLAPQHVVSTGGEDFELAGTKYNLAVGNWTPDMQFICKFLPSNANSKDISGKLFSDFSSNSMSLVKEGFSGEAKTFKTIGARFIYAKCITAGLARLYSGIKTVPGLLHALKFTDISFVKADRSEIGARTELNNSEIQQTGRPVILPFAGMFLGEFPESTSSAELAARLVGAPHVEISECDLGSAYHLCKELHENLGSPAAKNDIAEEFQLVRANMNFSAKVPAWFTDKEKAKYGEVAFPEQHFSPASARYHLSAGDSGTTTSIFGLWPTSILSTVDDLPVSGGLAVIPSTGGQKVQSSKGADCR
ncbi:MAG: hypothetical protein EBR09_09995 [Proteobacteria bacterium]|nr:hypothetical protein [Pseudomonadota bacterium]